MNAIRVSTIIPAFNAATTIAKAIDSALAQDFEGQEVIVVNDGSTDGTAAILAHYGNRIRTIEQPNGGYMQARNVAMGIARGGYFAFLDSDDIWLPGRIRNTWAALDRCPDAVLAFTDVIPMNEQGELGPPWTVGRAPTLSDLLTRGWRIYPSAVTMRRSTLEQCRGFDEEMTNFSDAYLWMCARELGTFEYLTEPLTIYRTIHYGLIGDKYQNNFNVFSRAVQRRYGRAGRAVVADCADALAGSLVTKAVLQRDRGEIIAAFRSLARAAWLSSPW